MSKLKIKKGDTVIVIAGKDKGAQGKVIAADPKKERVVVENVNRVKKHVKPNPNMQKPGGIIEKEASIHISNVALLNPTTQKADKVKIKIGENGKKNRYFKSNDQQVDI